MDKKYEKIFFSCDLDVYPLIQEAMKGLDAREVETTFDRVVYFYVMVAQEDLEEFNRRLSTP